MRQHSFELQRLALALSTWPERSLRISWDSQASLKLFSGHVDKAHSTSLNQTLNEEKWRNFWIENVEILKILEFEAKSSDWVRVCNLGDWVQIKIHATLKQIPPLATKSPTRFIDLLLYRLPWTGNPGGRARIHLQERGRGGLEHRSSIRHCRSSRPSQTSHQWGDSRCDCCTYLIPFPFTHHHCMSFGLPLEDQKEFSTGFFFTAVRRC